MGPKAFVKTVSAPTGGYNARDALAKMPETDAVRLVNWVPDVGGVKSRKGYAEWATVFAGDNAPINSILAYFAQATTFPGGAYLTTPTTMPGGLFAATDAAIYDITSATATPPSVLALSDTANAGWLSSTMMVNSAGASYLLVCSEADGYITYDGTTWLKVSTEVTVADPTSFVHVSMWKRRAWFVERNSSKVWYLDVDSPYGAAASFDFGPLLKHGGNVAFTTNWTIDAGEGIDDLLVIVGNNGDVCVYKGTDPTSAITFSLIGTWYVGQIPEGRRAYTQYGGDVVVCSADGIFPLSYVTRGGADFLVASSKEYSSKIRAAIGPDLRASFTTRGWQMLLHPTERLLLVTVPDYSGAQSKQYALNTTLNEWCVLSAIPMLCVGATAGYAFAGTADGRVVLVFSGYQDNVPLGGSTGADIAGLIVPAFNYFELPALQKQFTLVRPTFLSVSDPSVEVGISVDFQLTLPEGAIPVSAVTSAVWDTALWDTAVWGGVERVFSEWASVGEVGFCGTATLETLCSADTTLCSIDYTFEAGGV